MDNSPPRWVRNVDWLSWVGPWGPLLLRVRARIGESRRRMREEPDAGYITEAVIGIALLALLAIAVITIVGNKIKAKANNIDLDGTSS